MLRLSFWTHNSSRTEYSETLGLNQFYGLGLGLEAETQVIQSRSWSQNWDLENYSLGFGLKIETHIISVSDSVLKLRLREYQSRSRN